MREWPIFVKRNSYPYEIRLYVASGGSVTCMDHFAHPKCPFDPLCPYYFQDFRCEKEEEKPHCIWNAILEVPTTKGDRQFTKFIDAVAFAKELVQRSTALKRQS